MAARERRQRKDVERLGDYAADEVLEELDLESESEDEGSEVEEARGAVAKAARRGGGGGRTAPRHTAVTADMLSTLLAGAPALSDYLLLEDSVRSVTLCCRDVVNLNIAAGGSVNVEPVWQALASRVKAKAAEEEEAVAEKAAVGDAPGALPLPPGPAAPEAPPAPAAAAEPAEGAPAAAAGPEAAGPAAPAGPASAVLAAAAAAAAAAALAQPEPAGQQTRRGRAKKAKSPPEPSALDVVKAAVAADPARSADVRKTTAQWVYKISQKSVAALTAHKGQCGKTLYCRELDIRTLAWRRWGDQARMDAAKQRVETQEKHRRELYDQRMNEAKEARQEELALRLAEHGLPADTAQVVANYRLREWVQWGGHYWGAQSLGDLLAPIIQQHQARQEAEEQERLRSERRKLLDDSLEAEGLQFFKRDWRYRCFLSSGEADGLEALLGTARRQRAAQEAEGERHRELAERLDAAGLAFYHSTSPMFERWLKTGEGDVAAIVQQRRLRVDRECQLQYLLEMNGLLHRQNSERCKKFLNGELLHRSGKPYSAKEVVSSLLASLGTEHTRCQELLDRLREERLPPVMHLSWCQTYVSAGGDLDAVIYQVKEYVYSRADVGVPPPGRPWAAADNSTDARIGAPSRPPLGSRPAALCMKLSGGALRMRKMVGREGPLPLAVIHASSGSTVHGLKVQLLDASGQPAAATVSGKLATSWWSVDWQTVTWDAQPVGAEATPCFSLPPIQVMHAPGTERSEWVRFLCSSLEGPLELEVRITAWAPKPATYAPEGVGESEDAEPMDVAAAAAAAPADGDSPQGTGGSGDSRGGAAAAGAGLEQEAGAAPPASEAAAAEAEAEAEAAPEAAPKAAPKAAPAADGEAAETEAAAAEAAGLGGEQGASSPAAAAAAPAGQPPAAGEEEGTMDEAEEMAAEQPPAGGETPFYSAAEAVAATAARAGQQQDGGQPQQGQPEQEEGDGPAAMQE